MSTIIVDELRTTLSQEFIVKERLIVSYVKLYLYLHNDPSGTFILSIKENGTTEGVATLDMAQIKSEAGFEDNKYHKGAFRFGFPINPILNPDVTYELELSSTDYNFSESSYIGWAKEYENLTNSFFGALASDYERPFCFQLWGRYFH